MDPMEHSHRRSEALDEYLRAIQQAQDRFLSQQPNLGDLQLAFDRSNELTCGLLLRDYSERFGEEQDLSCGLEWQAQPPTAQEYQQSPSKEHSNTSLEDSTEFGIGSRFEGGEEELERFVRQRPSIPPIRQYSIMKADKALAQDEEADQMHDDQQASQLLKGFVSPEDDVTAVTLSPTQHAQVLELFGLSYRIDHFLVRALVRPILPDRMVEAMHSHDYDHLWMQAYGMADGFLEGWFSNLHMYRLYGRGVLKDQDQIKFALTSSLGVQVERSVTIQEEAGRRGFWARVDTDGYEMSETTVDLRRGAGHLIRTVAEQFGDSVQLRPLELYRSLKLWKDGELVGTMFDVRQRFTLWGVLIDLWAKRTGGPGFFATKLGTKLPLTLQKPPREDNDKEPDSIPPKRKNEKKQSKPRKRNNREPED
ncbi:MAG: hypothetical protein Q9212_003232 [Teloschistes hypoglaucus]